MPLNIESDTEGGVKKIAEAFCGFMEKFAELDISPLKNFIS